MINLLYDKGLVNGEGSTTVPDVVEFLKEAVRKKEKK